ncbi:dipeptide ABC transporter ATP-binding protein [Sulfuricystis multivorans]|uniref:dipeptide ABC transporter ATP-binding protein n=1 Tax=Sulfuricystis multivorans TaxID=2211108 RepID=UPI000F824A4F|nr:ABC transporter ATP-binding protein [Sulfuricystis multivorans]
MTLLTVRDLSIDIGPARPVEGVSFEIARGETFALVGESGCGKSLTALALLRLLPEAARIAGGMAHLGDTDLFALPEVRMREVRGGRIGMIFQEPATSLNPVMTIGSQIGEALRLHGGSADMRRVVELLTAVGIPDPERRAGEYPFQMSGGMKQRAMIAMALAGEPELLIADEPTTALDVTIQAQVLDLLARLAAKRGMAMLLITHDLGVVARMADRVAVMYAGELVEIAPRAAFFAQPAHPYAQRLFAALPATAARRTRLATIPGSVPNPTERHAGCRFVARCSVALPVCGTVPPPWREPTPGHRVRCHLETATKIGAGGTAPPCAEGHGRPTTENLLEAHDLKVHFPIRRGVLQRAVGWVRAVDGVDLSIAAGRTLALVGESGCGKTTVGKAILGLQSATAGTVKLAGRILDGLAPREMQMVFQDPFGSLDPRLTIDAIVREGRPDADVSALLRQVGLTPEMAKRYPHEFSGGQRQRIAIARALAVMPRLLICDEPTSALDVSVQAQILNLLLDLQARLGLAYLFITHNIAAVDFLAHEVAVMYLGRIVEQGTVEEVLDNPRHPYTQALLAAVPKLVGAPGERLWVQGDPPSPANPPPGCHFHPRCPRAAARCHAAYPATAVISATHWVRCYFPD